MDYRLVGDEITVSTSSLNRRLDSVPFPSRQREERVSSDTVDYGTIRIRYLELPMYRVGFSLGLLRAPVVESLY